MARPPHPYDEYRHGKLVVEKSFDSDCVEVYYIPSQEQIEQANIKPNEAEELRVKILELDNARRHVTVIPISTLGKRSDFLKPKYNKIKRITIADATPVISVSRDDTESPLYSRSMTFGSTVPMEHSIEDGEIADAPTTRESIMEILEGLPPAFTKDYDYGLGLAKPYHFIIDAIEEMCDCEEMLISEGRRTEIDHTRGVFYISRDDFETLRKSLNSATNLSRKASGSFKKTHVYNFLAEKIGKKSIPLRFGRHPLRKILTDFLQSGGKKLSSHEQDEVLDAMSSNITTISNEKPEKLARLRRDIELVNLERLIDRFEEMMTTGCREGHWQMFFDENQFVLSMAFGYPITMVQGQASVGGGAFSGKGDRFTDFLVMNSMTNNAAIIEIKTPGTELMTNKEYRSGVFSPSSELSGAINQALGQKHRLEKGIVHIKENSRRHDLESYSIHCCLIIGRMPSDESKRESFELFRRNSKDVEIVTFDELLRKLKGLREFLDPGEGEASVVYGSDDVPF